jgi:hypothetical protein
MAVRNQIHGVRNQVHGADKSNLLRQQIARVGQERHEMGGLATLMFVPIACHLVVERAIAIISYYNLRI